LRSTDRRSPRPAPVGGGGLIDSNGRAALSRLEDQIRRIRSGFSEKALGYRSFLQFCRAGDTTGAVHLEWEDDDYLLPSPQASQMDHAPPS